MYRRKITSLIAGPLGTLLLGTLLPGTLFAQSVGTGVRHSQHPVRARYVARGPGKADVSLNVKHAPVRTVLRLLFRRADQSYVFGPFVSGIVTLTLHHVPFSTALRRVLSANSVPLRLKKQGRVYTITGPPGNRTSRRVFIRHH